MQKVYTKRIATTYRITGIYDLFAFARTAHLIFGVEERLLKKEEKAQTQQKVPKGKFSFFA